jgi:hypothetical protein
MKWPYPLYYASAILLVVAIHIVAAAPFTFAVGPWLDKWQTLITGFLALFGAWLTIDKINDQISQIDRMEKKRLYREHQAVRATLPLTLSAICEWASGMAIELNRAGLEMRDNGERMLGDNFAPPDLPFSYIPEIQQIIKSTDDPTVVKPLCDMIREMQTLWARCDGLKESERGIIRVGILAEIDSHIIQAGKIYALAGSLFEYSRGASEAGPEKVAWDLVTQFLMSLRIETQARFGLIERRANLNRSFWELSGEYWKEP